MTAIFPFSAVLGQARLKQALLLCAIDPSIGGVLVQGPRGVAKTTLARAFAELLPGRFVELPLGATEERVAGSLDLGKVLGQGEVQFAPGLLARAHDGVLYVDEVNLLPDALVDLLLDAAATGQNVVERDGVSHVHPARFVLIGTMNPEEGELRPQLIDRFGLSVRADALLGPSERTQVVLRRLEFDQAPGAFVARFEREQEQLRERCRMARERLPTLPFAGPGVARAAELCHAAGVEGVRADLAMLRAARAHAAWNERDAILPSDVDAVAELALAHRRRGASPASSGGEPSGSAGQGGGSSTGPSPTPPAAGAGARAGARETHAEPGIDPGSPSDGRSSSTEAPAGSPDARSPNGSGQSAEPRGALAPVPVRSSEPPCLPAWLLRKRPAPRGASARHRTELPMRQRQRRARGTESIGDGAIDWVATLLHGPRPTLATLRRRPRRLQAGGSWVVAIDCSASMLRSGALAGAKGIARALARRALQNGARFTLLSFGGPDVQAHELVRGRERDLDAVIATLGAGGGTPLRRAIQLAFQLGASPAQPAARRVVLLTDGRTRENLDDIAPPAGLDVIVIDCERGPVRLGRARRIALSLSGTYVSADAVTRAAVPAAAP